MNEESYYNETSHVRELGGTEEASVYALQLILYVHNADFEPGLHQMLADFQDEQFLLPVSSLESPTTDDGDHKMLPLASGGDPIAGDKDHLPPPLGSPENPIDVDEIDMKDPLGSALNPIIVDGEDAPLLG